MIKKYLEQIWNIKVDLILTKKIWNITLNSAIFWDNIPENLVEYKKNYIKILKEKENFLKKILEKIENEKLLEEKNKKILEKEIFIKVKKTEFLKWVYDVEANKLDYNYKIKEKIENYDYYNKIFYGVDKTFLYKEVNILENKEYNIFISKEKLEWLLEFSKKLIPELKWDFWNFAWLAHNSWILKIPLEKEYNIKRIIVIFFHEMTHFFRYINWKNNLWFDYVFSNYNDLEEWIAWYNEYFYWNKILNYWKYNAYYDKCYQIILEDIFDEEKKEKIFEVLKNKWFDRKKIDWYYERFYRYTKIWWKKLFLKDLIYNNAYENVINLIKKDEKNYEKIMAWKISLFELKSGFIDNKINFDSRKYFDIILEEIKKLV